MNILSTKSEVDEYTKTLLSLSKNEDDVDLQCLKVAKLYFQVSEFSLAKYYIERYLKLKSNSESGLILKAKIHENLKENILALRCYESLYNISKDGKYILEVCDCLLKCDVGEKVPKMWIDILETQDPYNERLCSLKLKFYTDFTDLAQELERLRNKLDTDTTNKLQRQYLSILEKVDNVKFVLEKCIDIINQYDVLDDFEMVVICTKIFAKASDIIEEDIHKQLHCVLLVSLIKNGLGWAKVNYSQYLKELYNLLILRHEDDIYPELRAEFLYSLVSYAHWVAIINGEVSGEIGENLFHGYVMLSSIDKFVTNDKLSPRFVIWLNHQSLLRISVVSHMVYNTEESFEDKISSPEDSLRTIISFSKVDIDTDSIFFRQIIEQRSDYLPFEISTLMQHDLICYSSNFTDFSLVMWQMLCYLDVFIKKDSYPLDIPVSASNFIIALIKRIFPKLSLYTAHNRCPENLCSVDVITFLLLASITYRRLPKDKINVLPIPFICSKSLLEANTDMEKWWHCVCDFLLNNKRNTSVGPLKEYLKKGLNSVQCIRSEMPAIVKLLLGRYLLNFAKDNQSVNEVCAERAAYFQLSAIQSYKVTHQCHKLQKMALPITKSSSISSSFEVQKDIIFFAPEVISEEAETEWRFEALLFCIKRQLKSAKFADDFDKLDEFINDADNIKINSPHLYLLKSKVYLTRASIINKEKDSDTERFQFYLTMASKYVEKCDQNMNSLTKLEQNELKALLQQQHLTLTKFNEQLSYISSDFKDNDPCIDLRHMNTLENRHQLSFSNSIKNSSVSREEDNERMKQLEHRIELINESDIKLDKTLNHCFIKCTDRKVITESHQSAIRFLKHQSKVHNDIYSSQMMKIESLTRKFDKFLMIEDHYNQLKIENEINKEQLRSLLSVVQRLEQQNMNLDLELQTLRCSPESLYSKIDKIVKPELASFNEMVDSKLTNIKQIVKKQLNTSAKLETMLIKVSIKNKQEIPVTKEEPVNIEDKEINFYKENDFNCDLFSNDVSKEGYQERDYNILQNDYSNPEVCHTYNVHETSLYKECHSVKTSALKTKNKEKIKEVEFNKRNYNPENDLQDNYVNNFDGDMDFNLGSFPKNSNRFENNFSHLSNFEYPFSESKCNRNYHRYLDIKDQKDKTDLSENNSESSDTSELSVKSSNAIEIKEPENLSVELDYKVTEELYSAEVLLEEKWRCVYRHDGILHKNHNNSLLSLTVEINILLLEDIDEKTVRFLMKLKANGTICYNQLVSMTSPRFSTKKSKPNTIHWRASDFSNEYKAKEEQFALIFKSTEEVKKFITVMKNVQ